MNCAARDHATSFLERAGLVVPAPLRARRHPGSEVTFSPRTPLVYAKPCQFNSERPSIQALIRHEPVIAAPLGQEIACRTSDFLVQIAIRLIGFAEHHQWLRKRK